MCTCVSGALVKTHVLPAVGRAGPETVRSARSQCAEPPVLTRGSRAGRAPGNTAWRFGVPWPCKSSLGVCVCVRVCLSVCLLPPPFLLSFSLAPSFGLRPCLGVRLCPWVGLCACAPGSPPGCRACAGLECHLSVGLPVTRLFQALADDGSCHAAGRGAEC